MPMQALEQFEKRFKLFEQMIEKNFEKQVRLFEAGFERKIERPLRRMEQRIGQNIEKRVRLFEEHFCFRLFVFSWTERDKETGGRGICKFVTPTAQTLERIRRLARNAQDEFPVLQGDVKIHIGLCQGIGANLRL